MSSELIRVDVDAVGRAWDEYLTTNKISNEIVNSIVVNSWNRCRILKVDPFANYPNLIHEKELNDKIKKRHTLINIARPFMENIYNFVKGSGFQVVLSDEHGILLDVLGDPEVMAVTKKVLLCPGGDWSEKSKGTNAIGTAIVEQRPTQIFATEHFCQVNQFLTCSAAPIHDPEGQLLGVLDVSGDYRKANPHTLGMVVAAAYAIESQLRLHKATSKLYMAYKYSNTIMESMSEGLVSVDSNGNITQLNSIASKILGLDQKEDIGQNLETLLNSSLPITEVISSGEGYQDKEIFIDNTKGRRHFTSNVTPILDDQGEIIGATATLREMKEVRRLVSKMTGTQARFNFHDIIGKSEIMQKALGLANMAAQSLSTVLLNGESGTGKELFAQAIHNSSGRKNGPFIAINCAALPRDLIESELFGYEEGSFTGAQKGGRPGKFELASGGTIFLDEIGDMPLETQVKLLRVLQEKQVTRVGGHKVIPVDIRIVAATHRNLNELIKQGSFRLDLFYRLNVISIVIPPLRERNGDLVLLTTHLVQKVAARLKKNINEIPDAFIAKVLNYNWPGNVRELENALERAINLAPLGILSPQHLPCQNKDIELPTNHQKDVGVGNSDSEIITPLWLAEKQAIEKALAIYEGNISQVAKVLGIGRNTLYRKMKEYNLH